MDALLMDALLWDDGRMRDLGSGSPPLLIERGQVVGYSTSGYLHAALWERSG